MSEGGDSVAKRVVREFVARLNAGGDVWRLLSDRVVVTVNGTTPLSGRFEGVELVRGILIDSAKVVLATLRVETRELIGQGSRVAALLAVSGRTTAGASFNETGKLCGCAFSVNADRISEITFFPDTSLIEMALYGRRYVPDG